jgi:hypothetical protein
MGPVSGRARDPGLLVAQFDIDEGRSCVDKKNLNNTSGKRHGAPFFVLQYIPPGTFYHSMCFDIAYARFREYFPLHTTRPSTFYSCFSMLRKIDPALRSSAFGALRRFFLLFLLVQAEKANFQVS